MSDTETILTGYITESQFADGAKISVRTVIRYRNQPDGLPYLKFGRRIYIPFDEARDWLRARVKRPNARRRAV
ncbi:helix-turn-helix domain-containing protein [Bradyrhizobium sp. USDA 4473]